MGDGITLAPRQGTVARNIILLLAGAGQSIAICNYIGRAGGIKGKDAFRVLVGDFHEEFEGSSFLNVHDLYVADIPLNATELQQVQARVDRADGHRGLPPSQ